MTRLHRFYFFWWKIWMYLNGITPGTFFLEYSEEKGRNIKGVVTSLNGESVTTKKFGFDIYIDWLEPLKGFDSRYYSCGSYSYKDVVNKLRRV